MAEEIHTGGLKKFIRGKEKSKMEPELEKAIENGYKLARQRKRRNKIIKISVIVLILLIILFLYLLLA